MDKLEQPKAMKIASIKKEAEGIKTFTFEEKIDAKPGQFILLWIPRLNLKPFGVSRLTEKGFEITVCKRGDFTEKLFEMRPGEYVGIQGPYGKPFSMHCKNAVLVGGGYGTAPLAFLADELAKRGTKVRLLQGARNKDLLIYQERFAGSKVELITRTDDGSCGNKGFSTCALKEALESDKSIDMIYTCGPEVMMQKVIELADFYQKDCECSLERYMKCGFGVCGQCCIDDTGSRVCTEGPVYAKEYIKKYISEFGKPHRDGTGTRL